jgi:replicative DNA helicase
MTQDQPDPLQDEAPPNYGYGPDIPLPPHSIPAEQALLGALMLDNAVYDEICQLVSAVDFYRREHRAVFEHIEILAGGNRPFDAVSVSASVEAVDQLDDIGGLPYLGELISGTASSRNAPHYAKIVRANAQLRRLAVACADGQQAALSPAGRDPTDVAAEIEAAVFACVERRNEGGLRPVRAWLQAVVADIDKRARGEFEDTVKTGLADLDNKLPGFEPGQLILIGARPGMGKSALALKIAMQVALVDEKPVAYFSLEMSASELVMRAVSALESVPLSGIVRGTLTPEQFSAVSHGTKTLRSASLMIDDSGACDATSIRGQCRHLKRQLGQIGLVVIDYVQLMQAERKSENRVVELSTISRGLKLLAKEVQAPVLILSQLNRQCEMRVSKRPQLSDLRESGSLEQDADQVLFVYRDEIYDRETHDKGIAEIIVAKCRNGEAGKMVKTAFVGQYATFRDLARPEGY